MLRYPVRFQPSEQVFKVGLGPDIGSIAKGRSGLNNSPPVASGLFVEEAGIRISRRMTNAGAGPDPTRWHGDRFAAAQDKDRFTVAQEKEDELSARGSPG